MALPQELQRELVHKAAATCGNCQELAKRLDIPKSSVHYYLVGRLTMPVSVLKMMLELACDKELEERIRDRGIAKNMTWANQYAQSIHRDMIISRFRLPSREELENDNELRRKAAAIVSYIMAEGSIWLLDREFGGHAANITFADHETDLYAHFGVLCNDVFNHDIGPPQRPGNEANAIRGFIYSRFVAEWLIENGVNAGEKAVGDLRLPEWVMKSDDPGTWVSALQPWCDGEGAVQCSRRMVAQDS